jgi:hypothetical protein
VCWEIVPNIFGSVGVNYLVNFQEETLVANN